MSNNAFVVVFPSIFSMSKKGHLLENIKKILNIKNLEFQKINQDNPLIIIEANDPVFASSAINLLFGIKRVAIAKKIPNDFQSLVSEISKVGGNLLLKGEKFHVKVEGISSGYVPKDIELAVTSSIIEKKSNIKAKPGTEEKHDKLLYSYLTKSNAYVCIFSDEGLGGIPNNSQGVKTVTAIFDELSAISCLEIIKEGFDVKIIICYGSNSNLLNLVKILNRIIPYTLKIKIEIEFYKISIKPGSQKNTLLFTDVVNGILSHIAKINRIDHVVLSLSPLIFPNQFVDFSIKQITEKNQIPQIPILGLEDNFFKTAKRIGIGKYAPKIEKLGKINFSKLKYPQSKKEKIIKKSLQTKKVVSIKLGPNNVHDILDSLGSLRI